MEQVSFFHLQKKESYDIDIEAKQIAEEHETVLMIGNRNSFPFVRSYAKPLKQKGNNVIFIGTLLLPAQARALGINDDITSSVDSEEIADMDILDDEIWN